jgi:hypothetical protein
LEIFTKPSRPQNWSKFGNYSLLLQIQEILTQKLGKFAKLLKPQTLNGLENSIFLLKFWKILTKDRKNPPNSPNTKFCFSIVLAKFGHFGTFFATFLILQN